MKRAGIRAVLFDLGETLLNFGKINTHALFTEAGRLSFEYLKSLNQPVNTFHYYLWTYLFNLRLRVLWSNITNNDFDSLEVLSRYGKRKGLNLTEQQWLEFNWFWYKPLRDKAHIEPDLHQTLQTLLDNGIKLGIISNTFVHGSALDRHLEEENLIQFFPMRIYSYQLDFRKPDKRIFLKGAEKIGVDPEHILYIGDRLDKDVAGAKKAGMTPVLKHAYTNENKTIPKGTIQIQQISELPDIICCSDTLENTENIKV